MANMARPKRSVPETIERSLADNGYVVLVDDMDAHYCGRQRVARSTWNWRSTTHALIPVRHAGSRSGNYATEPGDYMADLTMYCLPGDRPVLSALNVDDFVVKSSTLFVTEGFEGLAAM